MKIANPQGKGVVSLFSEWHEPLIVRDQRSLPTLIKEYVLSLLVLSAKFKFRPVQNRNYYLYLQNAELIMTLIEPEKSRDRFGRFVGSCNLLSSLTWHIEFAEQATTDPLIIDFLHNFYAGFESHHRQNINLTDLLPFFEASLPFYARMYANGLAKSIKQGMQQIGASHISAPELLAHSSVKLLE